MLSWPGLRDEDNGVWQKTTKGSYPFIAFLCHLINSEILLTSNWIELRIRYWHLGDWPLSLDFQTKASLLIHSHPYTHTGHPNHMSWPQTEGPTTQLTSLGIQIDHESEPGPQQALSHSGFCLVLEEQESWSHTYSSCEVIIANTLLDSCPSSHSHFHVDILLHIDHCFVCTQTKVIWEDFNH